MEVSQKDVESELQKYYNCTIKQVPMSSHNYIEIRVKVKTGVKKILNIIPVYEYKYETKKLYIQKHSTLEKNYIYLGGRLMSNLETVYDSESNTLFWRYSSYWYLNKIQI